MSVLCYPLSSWKVFLLIIILQMNEEFVVSLNNRLQQLSLQANEDDSDSEQYQPSDADSHRYEINLPISKEGRLIQRDQQMQLEDFVIGPTLGTGSYGRVRQVRFKHRPKEVYALKMLKKYEILKRNQLEHLKNEKEILTSIDNHFVIKLKATFQDDHFVYMLLEYVCGGELFGRLRKQGRFSNDVALFYIAQITTALSYLHDCGIAYRDLKPENILIDRQGHVRLTDFGFAKRLPKDRTSSICGTPEYLAPEIIECSKNKHDSSKHYGKSADWWALGILLFEMVAGYPPFFDVETNKILDKITEGVIEFPKFLSSTIKDLIRKLLNPDPHLRLGAKDNGRSILNHRWFKGVDWQQVRQRKIPAPWIPILKSDDDVSNFQKYPDSPAQPRDVPPEYQIKFQDF